MGQFEVQCSRCDSIWLSEQTVVVDIVSSDGMPLPKGRRRIVPMFYAAASSKSTKEAIASAICELCVRQGGKSLLSLASVLKRLRPGQPRRPVSPERHALEVSGEVSLPRGLAPRERRPQTRRPEPASNPSAFVPEPIAEAAALPFPVDAVPERARGDGSFSHRPFQDAAEALLKDRIARLSCHARNGAHRFGYYVDPAELERRMERAEREAEDSLNLDADVLPEIGGQAVAVSVECAFDDEPTLTGHEADDTDPSVERLIETFERMAVTSEGGVPFHDSVVPETE